MRHLVSLVLASLAGCSLHPSGIEDITDRPGIRRAIRGCYELAVDSSLGPAGTRFSITRVQARRSSAGTFPVIRIRFDDGREADTGVDFFDLALGRFGTIREATLSPVARLLRPCR